MFSNNETFTSVVESLRIVIIGGSIYSIISYLDIFSESSQIALAIDPLTC